MTRDLYIGCADCGAEELILKWDASRSWFSTFWLTHLELGKPVLTPEASSPEEDKVIEAGMEVRVNTFIENHKKHSPEADGLPKLLLVKKDPLLAAQFKVASPVVKAGVPVDDPGGGPPGLGGGGISPGLGGGTP